MKINIPVEDRDELYTIIRHQLGQPIRSVEVTDEMLDSLFKVSVEEYESMVYNWLTEQQWSSIYNTTISKADYTFYLMTRELKFEKSFTYAYSKEVNQGTNSVWERKMDYVVLSADTQHYTIPAGREISEVLWFTQPSIDMGRFLTNSGNFGLSTNGFGFSLNGVPALPINYYYNVITQSNFADMRQRIVGSDLTYRIDGGPEGTKILVLFPVPGGKYDRNMGGGILWSDLFNPTGYGGTSLQNGVVWYYYYDAEKERDKCIEDNDDVVLLPSDIPYKKIKWSKINEPVRIWIRKMLLAEAKMTLGEVRGKFSGQVKFPEAELQLDYNHLLQDGKSEKEKLLNELKEYLTKLDWATIMQKRAEISDNLKRILKNIPDYGMIG